MPKPCPMCQADMMPDQEVLQQMLEEAVMTMGCNDELEYFNNDTVLIVNNYLSLQICYTTLMTQTSLGVDLEGRLKVGGSINLIQIACQDTVFIIDVYHITVLDRNEQLLQLTSNVLKSAFLNDSIRKVFFDGKKDLEALHYIMNVGVRNFIDAQAVHMALT